MNKMNEATWVNLSEDEMLSIDGGSIYTTIAKEAGKAILGGVFYDGVKAGAKKVMNSTSKSAGTTIRSAGFSGRSGKF